WGRCDSCGFGEESGACVGHSAEGPESHWGAQIVLLGTTSSPHPRTVHHATTGKRAHACPKGDDSGRTGQSSPRGHCPTVGVGPHRLDQTSPRTRSPCRSLTSTLRNDVRPGPHRTPTTTPNAPA